MIDAVAMQQPGLKNKLRLRRAGITGTARHVRLRTDPPGAGSRDYPPPPSNPLPGRLRLVGQGGDPAHKVWRLRKMGTADFAMKIPKIPGLAGALRLLYAARALLALVGLALILSVMAVESRYNPVAESNMGAKGLMQVIPKFHADKLAGHGGESALLDPHVNIQVGAQILREYMRRFGETETALQMYAGAFDEPSSSYALKVLAERARLEQLLKQVKRVAS